MQKSIIKEIIKFPYKNFKTNILNEDDTIKRSIISINKSVAQIIFVINKKKQLVGTVTDGDIRRSVLKKIDLSKPLKKIMNLQYYSIKHETDLSLISLQMKKKGIHYIPLINRKRIIKKIYSDRENFSKEKAKKQDYPIIILSGGKGVRMKSLTKNKPKPMLFYRNAPMLEHIINNLKKNNFKNIYVSVYYLKNKIIKYFKNGKKFGVNIKYLIEKKPLGTGGCIKLLPKKNNNPIIVMNSDIICDLNLDNLISFHKKNKAYATMAVKVIEKPNPYGVVKTKGLNIEGFEEKPLERSYINAGIYIFSPKIKNYLTNKEKIDIPEIFKILKSKKKKIIIFPVIESWVDLGTFEKYTFYKKF